MRNRKEEFTVADIKYILRDYDDDLSVKISIDVSTNDADAHQRAFTGGFIGKQDAQGELVLLFEGFLNNDKT